MSDAAVPAGAVAAVGAPKPSRAGRDLPAAIGVGVGLGALIIASLLLYKPAFAVLAGAACLVGVWEIREALTHKGILAPRLTPMLGAAAMVWAAYNHGALGLVAAWVLTCCAVVLVRGAGRLETAARDVAGGMFAATYPPLLLGFAILLLAPPDGVGRVFTFIITAVCSDIFGYAVGVVLGKHPMAPSVSPKKSWEGFAGSVLGCVIAGSLTVHFFLGYAWWVGAVLGVGVAIAATVGDLMESLIKRDLGIKDMSNLLPGHGGIMDRLDSLVVVAPVVWFVLTQLGGIGS